jgi:hypothetical protein
LRVPKITTIQYILHEGDTDTTTKMYSNQHKICLPGPLKSVMIIYYRTSHNHPPWKFIHITITINSIYRTHTEPFFLMHRYSSEGEAPGAAWAAARPQSGLANRVLACPHKKPNLIVAHPWMSPNCYFKIDNVIYTRLTITYTHLNLQQNTEHPRKCVFSCSPISMILYLK